MSTRSILALQKGRRVRYCFLHWDGDNHGQTLKDMLDSEIEELYNAMAPIDEGNYLYLEHLYSQSYWDGYIEALKANWLKRFPNRPTDFEDIYMRPQPTAYLPVIPQVKKGDKPIALDPTEIGSYDTDRTAPTSVKEALNGHREFDFCEYVWFYNLDTRVITCFTDHKNWNWEPHTMNRRRRLTPKKYDFAWLAN
jgi:hypothetical protein